MAKSKCEGTDRMYQYSRCDDAEVMVIAAAQPVSECDGLCFLLLLNLHMFPSSVHPLFWTIICFELRVYLFIFAWVWKLGPYQGVGGTLGFHQTNPCGPIEGQDLTKKRAWSTDLRSSPDPRRPNTAERASVGLVEVPATCDFNQLKIRVVR